MTVFDVHVLEPVTLLLLVQLVEESLLAVDALDVDDGDETLITAAVAHHVVHVATELVDVDFLHDSVGGCSHVRHQVKHNVLETEVATDIERGATVVVSLNDILENIIEPAGLELAHDMCQLALVNKRKDPLGVLHNRALDLDRDVALGVSSFLHSSNDI